MAYDWIKRKDEIVWETTKRGHFNTVEAAVAAVLREYRETRTIFVILSADDGQSLVGCDTEPDKGWEDTQQIIGVYAPNEAREILLTYARML
jgi:hypothetical protein